MSFDRTLDPDMAQEPRAFGPVHPGEILLTEFLEPMGLSQNKLARALAVPPRRINEIVLGKRSITADTALRLAKFFSMSAEFWMGLQADYDLRCAEDAIRPILETKVSTWAKLQ